MPNDGFDKDKIKAKLKAEANVLMTKLFRKPQYWVLFITVVILLAIYLPNWERKWALYDVLKNGAVGAICLSHENSIFERSGISKSYANTQMYVRFDKITFLRDFLKIDNPKEEFIAVVMDQEGVLYWAEMKQHENMKLAEQYKITLGTCSVDKDFHKNIPGSAFVTNQ